MNNKNAAISLSRIVGMFLIILCHIIRYYDFIPGSAHLNTIFGCGVELFVFISGLLYGTKVIENFKIWYFQRFIRVAAPAIIISIIIMSILYFKGEKTDLVTALFYVCNLQGLLFINWSFFSNFITEVTNLGQLWFTTIIMLCYLLVPILQYILKKRDNKANAQIYTVISLLLVVLTMALIILFNVYITYFVIFIIGYLCGHTKAFEKITGKICLSYTALVVLVQVLRLITHQYIDGTFAYLSVVSIANALLGVWFVVFLHYLQNKNRGLISNIANIKAVGLIDKYSFNVYLVHGFFCSGMWNCYAALPLIPATLLFILLTSFAAVLLNFILSPINKISSKLLKAKKSNI